MKQKLLDLMLIMAMAFVCMNFASCGGSDDGGDNGNGGDNNSVVGTWRYNFMSNDSSRGMVYNLINFNSNQTGYLIEEVGYGSDKPESFIWKTSGNTLSITFGNGSTQTFTFTFVDNNTVMLSNNNQTITAYRQ